MRPVRPWPYQLLVIALSVLGQGRTSFLVFVLSVLNPFTVADVENLKGGVQRNQLNGRGFATPIYYNVRLLTSIGALLLADVSLVHFVVR